MNPLLTRQEQALIAFLLALLIVGGIVQELRSGGVKKTGIHSRTEQKQGGG
jgi:hypothetical protein